MTDGILKRGIAEFEDKHPQKRQEHDLIKTPEVLDHIVVETEISQLGRIGKKQDDQNKTIMLKVPNR